MLSTRWRLMPRKRRDGDFIYSEEDVHKNLINGEWVGADQGRPNINPSELSDVIGEYASSGREHVDQAIEAAGAAQWDWATRNIEERFAILDRAGNLILERREEIGRLLSREEGKILAEGIAEVTRAGQTFKYVAGEALRCAGETMQSVRTGVEVNITREPVGIVGIITPWNFPAAIPAWKIAPALAYGNTVVFKPADLVPGTASALVAILAEAGVPKGVVNLVMGPGSIVGQAIVDDPRIRALSFTGSTKTGRAAAETCARLGKKVQLEMGGKNPLIILNDADLDTAVNCALNGAFFATGQRCTASSRLIVEREIRPRFEAALIARMQALSVGHALDPASQIGPVVDRRQFDSDLEYIALGRKEAGRVVGGEVLNRPTEGFFLQPALFLDTTNDMRINREEIFGPVASIIEVADYEEAESVANDTEYGLSSGICTTSLKYAQRFRRTSQAGMVMVNLPTAGVDYHVPFGGRKNSSYGSREQGQYAIEFYTDVKTAYTAG